MPPSIVVVAMFFFLLAGEREKYTQQSRLVLRITVDVLRVMTQK